jgi:hypothetical protein
LNLKTYSPGGTDMTATLTSLIDLASAHGLGMAILLVGLQVVIDRLMPVEHIVSHLVGSKKSAPAHGAHRGTPAPRPSWASRFASSLAPDRNDQLPCMK